MALSLQKPNLDLLPSYIEALSEGSFQTMQLGFGDTTIAEIEADENAYIMRLLDASPYTFTAKGQTFEITEHELLWLTDQDRFLGTIALRYRGDPKVIHFAGHIGMAIRPGLLNKGYGIRAIRTLYEGLRQRALAHGLSDAYVTCDPRNTASRRLIEFFGGLFIDVEPALIGDGENARFEIMLD